jgi:ABC-type tungstate transport system permease subunit
MWMVEAKKICNIYCHQKMTKTENFEQIEVTSATKLREWLLKNHTQKREYMARYL